MSARHTGLALLVVLIWGVNFVAIDIGLKDVPPLLFVAMRFVLVAIPAIFFVKRPGIGWRQVLLVGAFLSFGQFVLLYLALALGLPPGLSSLLAQTQIVFTVVVSSLLLREHPSRRQVIGILIGMSGLAVVVIGHSYASPWLPVLVALSSALSWAIGNVLARRARASSGLSLVVWSALVVPVPAFGLALLLNGAPVVFSALAHLSLAAILSTVYTAVFASLVGYTIWNSLLTRYPTSAVVPFTLLVPIVGIATAAIVFHEQPALTELIGGAIMLGGLAVAVLRFSKDTSNPVVPPLTD
jgi:O-acetylserine/cysteine efflux transporter